MVDGSIMMSSDIASNFMVSDKISDHMALHASLVCQRPHSERKYNFFEHYAV